MKKRHWVIGNGSSLNETPLELLKDEVSWGMNRIDKIYHRTSWRPTYYLMVDFNQQNPKNYWHDCVRAHWDTPKWLWEGFRDGHPYFEIDTMPDVPNTTWIPRCQKHHYYMAGNVKAAQSWHLPEICTAFSGIGAVIQLAVQNGADEIYLLGCDLYEGGDNYGKNFFANDYAEDHRDRSDVDNTNMIQVHKVARRSSPVPIYNATIGGKLEVYPRVDMRKVLNG